MEKRTETYFASLNVWSSMAHYVGKTLNIRPNTILDDWGCAELLVAFGTYANEETGSAYNEWQYIYGAKKGKQPPCPKKIVVEFING